MEQIELPDLKTAFLSGQIDGDIFLAKILEADQIDKIHTKAQENLAILEDEEVKKRLQEPEETFLKYCNTLSFTNFHLAQIEAIENSNPEEALTYFKKALEAAQKIKKPDYQAWIYYIQGTISYLEKDSGNLAKIIERLPEGLNRKALERLRDGLVQRGGIDYAKDYQV